jgi:hypothetical protein
MRVANRRAASSVLSPAGPETTVAISPRASTSRLSMAADHFKSFGAVFM